MQRLLASVFRSVRDAGLKGIYYLIALAVIAATWWNDAGIIDAGFDFNLGGIKLLAKLEPYHFWTKTVSFLRFINAEKMLLVFEVKWAVQLIPFTIWRAIRW